MESIINKLKNKRFVAVNKDTYNQITMLSKELGYPKGEIVDIIVRWYKEGCEKE